MKRIVTGEDLSRVLDQLTKLQDEKKRLISENMELSQTLEWVRDDLRKLLDALGGAE